MELVTQVQTLDEAVCIPLHVNALVLPPTIGK